MTLYDLDLLFMRSASYYGVSESVGENSEAATADTSGGGSEVMVKCSNVSNINYICAHLQVHLGDLARYRGQNKRAENFYRHSLKVAPASGHAYNQLALLEVNKGCSLTAIFYYIRALALKCPFPAASSNLSRMYAKVMSSEATDFVSKFLKFEAFLHTAVHLKKAVSLCQDLCETLTDLVASEAVKTKDLLKCISILLFHIDSTNILANEICAPEEKLIRRLQTDLLAGMLSAFLLPVHSVKQGQALLDYFALPLIKIILDWILINENIVNEAGFMTKQQIWSGLALLLNDVSANRNNTAPHNNNIKDETFPLPEEFDLQAFLPIVEKLKKFNFRQVLKGGSLASADVKALRATRILEQGHAFCNWKGRQVLTLDNEEEAKFKAIEETLALELVEAFQKELDLPSLDESNNEEGRPELEEENRNVEPQKSGGGGGKKSKNVAMAAILRQATTTTTGSGSELAASERQVTFKTPSPNLSEDSGSQISQEDSRSFLPPYMMKAPQRPNNMPQQPLSMDFSVPPPPIMGNMGYPQAAAAGPRFDMPPPLPRPSWGPLIHPQRPVTSAEMAATFGGPSYSLFSGNSPAWSLPSRQQAPGQQQQRPAINQQNFLFQSGGPSPLEKLLQQNPKNK